MGDGFAAMTRDLGDAARSMGALSAGVDDGSRRALAAAAVGRAELVAALRAAAGPDLRLRNAGRVGVRVDAAPTRVALAATGPVGLLESRVPAHRIAPRAGRVLGGAGLSHPVTGPVRHPGYGARRVWSRATRAAVPDVSARYRDDVSRAMFDDYRRGA